MLSGRALRGGTRAAPGRGCPVAAAVSRAAPSVLRGMLPTEAWLASLGAQGGVCGHHFRERLRLTWMINLQVAGIHQHHQSPGLKPTVLAALYKLTVIVHVKP